MTVSITTARHVWPLRGQFAISRGAKTEAVCVVATIRDGEAAGRGECTPYARYGETVDSTRAAIEDVAPALAESPDRATLARLLPPGAARNALDCALWDLEAKQAGKRAWTLAGIAMPDSITTAYTLSADTPEAMAKVAKVEVDRPLLKLKLVGDGRDLERVEAVRAAAPRSRLIVDANEGWSVEDYRALAPIFAGLGVTLIEQPMPADEDAALADLPHPVTVCADESAHVADDVARLADRYDAVNIKLDKAGGLTEALDILRAAREHGMQVMVGCMMASSLAMAPAMLLAAQADVVDLDGPLWLARDQVPPLAAAGSVLSLPEVALWG